ncbi:fibrous sheath-interacting protein 1 isoform X2 [Oreochromis niloticus]|uniref:fibrous sheath-interacting protein 1 isoform X2 n=1 Tax=Oreochromis niloticus TaxID=8128 RepID=UPI00090576AA|nr:fibrous sheath-interacting protein 1 isoform X2 [Oreochromis niloticus]
MEITRGTLDDISRPASSEQTATRVSSVSLPQSDRICPTAPFSLVVLPSDAPDAQIPNSSEETTVHSSATCPGKDQFHADASEGENRHFKLQRAIEEMKRLDDILSAKIFKLKEVRRQRKEFQAKLWQEFKNKPEGHSGCAQEALNTRLFLALEAPEGTDEDNNVIPVFDTQIPEHEQNGNNQHLEPSRKRPDSLTRSFEGDYEDTREDQFESSHSGDSKGMNKHKDFVKKNIELVNGEGGEVLLTQAEKRRLAELLREIDEEEDDTARGADSKETMWAVSVPTVQGYTPEPSDLEQLIDIDSKIGLLLPVEEFHSVHSSYTNLTMSQQVTVAKKAELTGRKVQDILNNSSHYCCHWTEVSLNIYSLFQRKYRWTPGILTAEGLGSEVSWKCDGDPQPGEKVLQDIKERRGQERRLQEIQRQLELLGQSQEMTCSLETIEHRLILGVCRVTTRGLSLKAQCKNVPRTKVDGPDFCSL